MFTKPLTYLLLSPILINSTEVEDVDPCAIISKKPVVSYQETMSYLNMIKLAPKTKNSVYDTINKALSIYIFIDIAERSPEFKIPSNINIRKELAKMVSKPYKSENEYHNSITKFITSLYDDHLRYRSNCATMFEFKQPFPVFTEENQWGEIKVKVLEKLEYLTELIEAWKLVGVKIARYTGKEIIDINGLHH
ncbi:hypothetical protein K502DRAFT_361360 [Neoconidiobolus thromboides FSU 785]|nr:hypothetical protein K502DRAFT_361360 [Neoconidiobolus thromboides FSU 785]